MYKVISCMFLRVSDEYIVHICKKISQVNSFTFIYRLFHQDLSSIIGTNTPDKYSSFMHNMGYLIIILMYKIPHAQKLRKHKQYPKLIQLHLFTELICKDFSSLTHLGYSTIHYHSTITKTIKRSMRNFCTQFSEIDFSARIYKQLLFH